MSRLWFNRTFSSVRSLFELIRQADVSRDYQLICTHDQPEFPGFLAADESALEPAGLSGPDYLEHCLRFCQDRRIQYLWPGKEAEGLAAEQSRFVAVGTRVLSVADADDLALLRDKSRFSARAQTFCIPPPASRAVRNRADFEAAYAELRTTYPVLCIKPAEGVNGIGFRVIDERRTGLQILLQGALHAIHLSGLRELLSVEETFPPLLLMEYLDGPEYSVDAVGDGQQLVALVQREKATPGGYGQRIVALPTIEQAVAEMTSAFRLRGLFNVQFRQGRDGLRVLEINPRFSGGIGYTGVAGVNLPYLAVRGLIAGFADAKPPAVMVGARVLEVPRACRVEEAA